MKKKEEIKRCCDFPGCTKEGAYKAPKNRLLNDYYWFCLEHVTQYNKNWDFYLGLSSEEIERHIQNDVTWQRPTWRLGDPHNSSYRTDKIKDDFHIFQDIGLGMNGKYNPPQQPIKKPHERLLLAANFLEVEFPLKLSEVKKQYKKLAKKYHPDTNAGDKEAEEMFKKLNEYYRYILKHLGEEN